MKRDYTHMGVLTGDARTGSRSFWTRLRLTPSERHWVDAQGRKYRRSGGGYVGQSWPLYFLDASSIREIDAQAIEARRAETAQTGLVEDESAVPQGCAQTPPSPSGDNA